MTSSLDSGRILLTGATGFIGSKLARRLNDDGASVIATHRGNADADLPVAWVDCDLTDFDEVRDVIRDHRPDVVFHLASHVTGSRALDVVRPTLEGNLVSTVALLSAATEARVARCVIAGSLEEPDGAGDDAIPCSPYAAAKGAATAYARMFHALYGLNVSVARIFMVYGPGQRDVRKLVPYVIRSLLKGQPPRVSSGSRPVDWIYVDDVVDGLVETAARDHLAGRRVDLGSGKMVTVREVVSAIARLFPDGPEPEFGAVHDRPMERILMADLEETRRMLGWEPRVGLEAGLRATIEWYAERLELNDAPVI